MTVESCIGVVGAGVMGAGVAGNLAQSGYTVILLDINDAAIDKARATIRDAVRLQKMMGGAPGAPSPSEVIERITFTTDDQALSRAGYIVENVPEIWATKQEVYHRIEAIAPKETIFAANTSCIPITRIARETRRPDRVIGIHFMNPVPMRPTVEVIRGWHTSDATVEATRTMLSGMGKDMIVVRDGPGFVSNRILMLEINEAVFAVQDGTAEPADVDRIFRECFGHRSGPLETADLIGLDTILNSLLVLYDDFRDGKFRPCPLLRKMVDAGLLGRKSGEGFFRY